MVTSTKTPLQDPTVIQANQFPIKSVKLFTPASAEVTRTFPLSFLRSQDDPQVVEIVNLPTGLQSADVSVTSTSGNITILDHYYTFANAVAYRPVPKLSSQTLRELEAERLRLEDEKRLRQQSMTFLTTYMDSLAQCKSHTQPEAAQMVSFFDDFVDIGITRSTVIAELDGKLTDVNNKIKEEEERLDKLDFDLPAKVVTVLSYNSQVPVGAAELTVTYTVRNVSWNPEYDLHISMIGNTPSPTVKLDFRCSVTQWTGENWENASLALTTANQVSQLIQMPEPKRVDVSLGLTSVAPPLPPLPPPLPPLNPPPPPRRRAPTWRPRSPSIPATPESPSWYCPAPPRPAWRCDNYRVPPPPPAEPVDYAAAYARSVSPETVFLGYEDAGLPPQTVYQLVSHGSKDPITHVANGSIFVPSDGAAHHILVATLSLPAEFMRVAVPSIDTHVYYTCEVKNTSNYVLLPGTVKTYLNDKHVSSTIIQNTDAPQILECSLAVDTSVKTIHNRAPDALPSVAPFTGKATTTYTSATVLHNTHAEPIRGVIVRSAIPLPADPRITIVLKEPAGLTGIDEGTVTVKEGCQARWSTMGGRKGKQAGLFEWVCDVNPGTEVLKAVWEVCAPQDLKLFEQVHS